ncbi:MAG TPA: ABC transporter permease [Thermoanaerobaculia bacterium]
MLTHNLWLAWKSVRRNPILSFLIIAGIALGVAVSTSFVTVWHVLAKDPIPGKSDRLHYVRLDSWDPVQPWDEEDNAPPPLLTYQDMRAAMKSDIPVRKAAMAQTALYVYPGSPDQRPFREAVRLTFSDFFPMFDVPFQYGSGWSPAADAKPEAVTVISSELNERLFGGRDSVGERLRLADREFRIVGVLAPWRPKVLVYDMSQNPYAEPEQIFIPFNLFEPMALSATGNQITWTRVDGNTFMERARNSEMIWIGMWAEFDNAGQRQAYLDFLNAYVNEQKKAGRFQRPLNNRLTAVVDLMEEWEVVPRQAKALAVISLLFLVIAALNLIGLFLGKFLARASVVGVRRALGASRRAIFLQHLVECELIGLIGGACGLLLSLGTLALVNRYYQPAGVEEKFFTLDPGMMLAAIGFALLAGAIAGVYPAWRICSIPPARHLKNQ